MTGVGVVAKMIYREKYEKKSASTDKKKAKKQHTIGYNVYAIEDEAGGSVESVRKKKRKRDEKKPKGWDKRGPPSPLHTLLLI